MNEQDPMNVMLLVDFNISCFEMLVVHAISINFNVLDLARQI